MAEETERPNAMKGGTKAVVAIGAVVIVALVAVIVFLLLRGDEPEEEQKRNVVVTEENAQETIDQMEEVTPESVEPGYYTVTMNNEWHFADGASASYDSYVANAEENTSDVYFDLYLANAEDPTDLGDPIYMSPLIPVGSHLDGVALEEPLYAGTYECICEYHLVDDEQNTKSTVSVTVTLIIES